MLTKSPLCPASIDGYSPHPVWIEPGHPIAIDHGLFLDIEYARQADASWPDSQVEIIATPIYNQQKMRPIRIENNCLDLRYLNEVFLIFREHNTETHSGRPLETLVDVYRLPLTVGLPL